MRTVLCAVTFFLSVASAATAAADDANRITPRDGARPITNVDPPTQTTAERRTALLAEVDRLQRERDALLSQSKDPSATGDALDHQDAAAKLRKMNKIRSELLILQ